MSHTTEKYIRLDAPTDWVRESDGDSARTQDLAPSRSNWKIVRALQDLYVRGEEPTMRSRELNDALDEHYHN